MPINHDAAGMVGDPVETHWTSKDALLYAVGVGAGIGELPFTTENSAGVEQQVLPTFPVVVGAAVTGLMAAIGPFNPAMMVHGQQAVTLHRPLPPDGAALLTPSITGVYDKGKAAVVALEVSAALEASGEPLFTTAMSLFIRGEGGWGGDRGPSGPVNEPPDRAPDHEVTYQTSRDQALVYRLSGDRNPLHSDPEFARLAGFDRPILHGLCTYGFTGRALLHTLCGSDPARFRHMEGRFSSPVFPGDALTVRMWVDGSSAAFTTARQDGTVVLDQGRCDFA
jgi:acyl dehydratase